MRNFKVSGVKVKGSRNLIQAQAGKDAQSTFEFLAKSKTVANRKEDPYMNNLSFEKMSKQERA